MNIYNHTINKLSINQSISNEYLVLYYHSTSGLPGRFSTNPNRDGRNTKQRKTIVISRHNNGRPGNYSYFSHLVREISSIYLLKDVGNTMIIKTNLGGGERSYGVYYL
jgi:hypothetical protein